VDRFRLVEDLQVCPVKGRTAQMASIPERRGPSRRSRAEGTHELAALSVIVVWVLGVGLVAASPTITTTAQIDAAFAAVRV
jgi:hypothetical protein